MINATKDDKKEKIIEKISSTNSSFDNRDKINTKLIQKQLIEMGYNIDLINQVIRYFEVTSIEVALDYLSKTNDKWNHPFVFHDQNEVKNKKEIELCMICLDKSENHRIYNSPGFSSQIENEIQRSDSQNLRKVLSKESLGKNEISLKKNKGLICDICLSPIEDNYSLQCKHHYCKECIQDYLINKITNAEVENIKCPSKDCVININEEIIQNLVSPKDYDKYLKFLRRANYSKIPNSCICPIPDCDSYGIKISSNKDVTNPNNYFTSCQKGHIFCYNCNQISHPGLSCESKLEKEFFKWKESTTVKKCPKCGFYIEKNFGCNHMTCANKACNFEFCWICMGEYNQAHYNNGFSPCLGLQYTNENSFFIRSKILRFIRLICLYFWIFTLGILGLCFSSFVFAASIFLLVGIKVSQTIYDRSSSIIKIIYNFCLFFNAFSFGVIYLPVGWIALFISILISPFLYWLVKTIRQGFIVRARLENEYNDNFPMEVQNAEPNEVNNV